MIVEMEKGATLKQIGAVIRKLEGLGFKVQLVKEPDRTLVGTFGRGPKLEQSMFEGLAGVAGLRELETPYRLVGRAFHPEDTVFKIGPACIGDGTFTVIAGPCAVESREQLLETAQGICRSGAHILRGGAFKPRTSPYSFQGLGEEGLRILAEAREITGLPVVTEAVSSEDVPLIAKYADVIQVGARNMQNFRLLTIVGEMGKPVLLKRGMMATVKETLLAAEYVAAAGNPRVILCERGIRSFETATRNTLDLAGAVLLKKESHLPVIADPAHASGRRELVAPLTLAALAAGLDGVVVEVHPKPEEALSDGPQSLTIESFDRLMDRILTAEKAFRPEEQ